MSNKLILLLVLVILALVLLVDQGEAQQCGIQVQNKTKCADGFCCSTAGWCGTTDPYCGPGNCQSQCPTPSPPPPPPSPPPPLPPSPIRDIISEQKFDEMLKRRNDPRCPAHGFYTYYSFIEAANSFPEFGNTGNLETKTRELAAFFGQTSQETNGGWDGADDGKYAWGYCKKTEQNTADPHCVESTEWPCAPGKMYYGRGPIQISYNYNYGPAGKALNLPLLSNPELVENDPVVAFKTAIWFWMTAQPPKPSCHDVITGQWVPTPVDVAAGQVPGYGVIINIINGGLECNIPEPDDRVTNRIEYYKLYCGLLNISVGDNLDCYHQCPFTGCNSLLGGVFAS